MRQTNGLKVFRQAIIRAVQEAARELDADEGGDALERIVKQMAKREGGKDGEDSRD
jgi:hypothetical protein